jgi:non-heme chloroperoxidase
VKVHYSNNGQGKVLIFLHGGFVDSSIWKHQLEFFTKRYQVINIDMRGHGKSAGSDDQEYSVAMLADDVIELMDDLKIDKAVICGMSLGAMVAQNIAARFAPRIIGLCLVGATASLRLTPIERLITTVIFPKWVAMKLFSMLSTKQFLKLSFMLTWFMRGNKWLGKSETRAHIRSSIGSIKREEIKKIYAAFHTFRKQELPENRFPALLINGSNDSPVIHHHARFLKKRLGKRAQFIQLEKCGHACNFDNPELFNGLLERWIKKEIKSSFQIT